MWPFNRKGKKVTSVFGKYADNEVLKAVMSDTSKLQSKAIDYILLMVKTHEEIGNAVDIILKHDATIESITGTFITVLIGAPIPKPDSNTIRLHAVDDLTAGLGSKVVILHGNSNCLVGTVGNSQRLSYTAIIPDYKSKLNVLSALEFGEATEINV